MSEPTQEEEDSSSMFDIPFDESNLSLGFIDAITLDQVKEPENFQLIKKTVKLVCNRELNIQLILYDKPAILNRNAEKKKLSNKNPQKTESEIIKDALDVFGGIVIE